MKKKQSSIANFKRDLLLYHKKYEYELTKNDKKVFLLNCIEFFQELFFITNCKINDYILPACFLCIRNLQIFHHAEVLYLAQYKKAHIKIQNL